MERLVKVVEKVLGGNLEELNANFEVEITVWDEENKIIELDYRLDDRFDEEEGFVLRVEFDGDERCEVEKRFIVKC